MITSPFLTAWDPRQTLKGSRDPLGAMALWTVFGRQVVGNLTTVSTSVRDFTVTMLGYHLTDRARELHGHGMDVEVFLKWEQLAAYVRVHALEEFGFRGVERTHHYLAERGPRVTLSARAEHQILGDQKTYGLMGTYTMPSRSSGLLEGDPIRLTDAAATFVEKTYLGELVRATGKGLEPLAKRMGDAQVQVALEGKDAMLVAALKEVLKRRILAKERSLYTAHLLYNAAGEQDRTLGRQRVLAEHLMLVPVDRWSNTVLRERSRALAKQGALGDDLASKLLEIVAVDTVLAPVSVLFGFLQARNEQALKGVMAEVRTQWGAGLRHVDIAAFEHVMHMVRAVDAEGADRWLRMAACLREGHWAELVQLVLEQNRAVMQRRGAAAWIEVKNDKLEVRFVDVTSALLTPEQLQAELRFNYFLPSLQGIANQLRA